MIQWTKDEYVFVFILVGFYLAPTLSYGDVPALLVEEDLRCASGYYFRHERAPK
jgi:hypothetical protein